jgi:hypothetical protein
LDMRFEEILRESEVAWGYIAIDYRHREILGDRPTLTYAGSEYQVRLNTRGRIVSKKLLHDLGAKSGMKLTFKKVKEGQFSVTKE